MKPRSRLELASAFQRKGFRPREAEHTWYYLYIAGKRTPIRTKLSHGTQYRQYGPTLLGKVADQLHLTAAELADFVDCPLTYDSYIGLMRIRGQLR